MRFRILTLLLVGSPSAFAARPPASIFCGVNAIDVGHDLVSWTEKGSPWFRLRAGISPHKPLRQISEDTLPALSLEQLKRAFAEMPKSEPICWRPQWADYEAPSTGLQKAVGEAARSRGLDLSVQ